MMEPEDCRELEVIASEMEEWCHYSKELPSLEQVKRWSARIKKAVKVCAECNGLGKVENSRLFTFDPLYGPLPLCCPSCGGTGRSQ